MAGQQVKPNYSAPLSDLGIKGCVRRETNKQRFLDSIIHELCNNGKLTVLPPCAVKHHPENTAGPRSRQRGRVGNTEVALQHGNHRHRPAKHHSGRCSPSQKPAMKTDCQDRRSVFLQSATGNTEG